MVLADISGSNDVFQRLSCEIRDGLLRNINSIWQNRVVSDMTRQFREFAQRGGFATVTVATFFSLTRSLVVCNAGNPPPLVFRARDRSWHALHGESQAAVDTDALSDAIEDPNEYRHLETKLDVGDVFVLYGNGFAKSTSWKPRLNLPRG